MATTPTGGTGTTGGTYQFTDRATLATWDVYGQKFALKSRTFDGGSSFWLVQHVQDTPEQFVPRGRNLLNDSSVTMAAGVPRSVYSLLQGGDTDGNGTYSPASFTTPANYSKNLYPDQTPYYQLNGTSDCVLSNGLVVGTFLPNGNALQALQNGGKWYVVQVVNSSPFEFVPRGKNILASGQFASVSRPTCIGAFDSEDTDTNGAKFPTSFSTPSGYTKANYPDGTTYFKEQSKAPTTTTKPTILPSTSLNQDNDKNYMVAMGQKVTLSSTDGGERVSWWKIVAGVKSGLGLYTKQVEITIEDNDVQYFMVNEHPTAFYTLAESNYLRFKVTNAQVQKSNKVTVDSQSVNAGQPIIIYATAGAKVDAYRNSETTGVQLTPSTQTGTRYEFYPTSSVVGDKFKILQTEPGKTVSDAVEVTIIGNPADLCASIADGTVVGVWNFNQNPLVSRKFDNKLWVMQKVGSNPEQLVPRGKNMLNRADVMSTYKACIDRFAGSTTGVDGLVLPPEFPTTIVGYVRKEFPDKTPYYESNIDTTTVPVPVITSGDQSSVGGTIKGASGAAGTINVYLNNVFKEAIANITSAFSYKPDTAGAYTFRLVNQQQQQGSASITVTVSASSTVGTGSCAINDKQEIGVYKPSGEKIIARSFSGVTYVTQQTGTNPDKFVVKGANFLVNPDVVSSFAACQSVFGGGTTSFAGHGQPSGFTTPTGYKKGAYSDGTPYYEAITSVTDPGGSGGTGGGGTDTSVPTKSVDVQVSNTCGEAMQYAASYTIKDSKSTLLQWQDSKTFLLRAGTVYIHFRQRSNPENSNTAQEIIVI